MADWPPKKNEAFTVIFPIYDNDGDLVSSAAALDSEVSLDGAGFNDCTNEAAEIGSSGMYSLVLTAAEMNANIVTVITKTTTTDAKTAVNVMYTATRQLIDMAYPTTSGRSIDVTTTGEVGIDLDNIAGTLDAADIGANAITAEKIATDAIDADALATDAVAKIRASVSGTSDSGSATTMVDAARTEADTDFWKGSWIHFTSGNLLGQARLITAFDPATDTITFAPETTQSVATHTYEILPAGRIDVGLWLSTLPNVLQSGRVDTRPGALAANLITSGSIANNAITEPKIATGAITAAKFAAGAIDAAAIADAAIDAATFAAGAIDAAAIADSAIDSATFNIETGLRPIRSGTADDGGAATLTLDAGASAVTSFYSGQILYLTGGTGVGQAHMITAYNGSSKIATVVPNWETAPTAGTTFAILTAGPANVSSWRRAQPLALVSQRVDTQVSVIGAGAITATAIASSAITAAKIAADAFTTIKFADGALTAAKFSADAIDATVLAASAALEIADAILQRDMDQVEGGAPVHSLTTAILKAVSRILDNAGTLETYRTDGSTLHMSQTITTDASNDPIDELSAGT
jgi:hypothetical protein